MPNDQTSLAKVYVMCSALSSTGNSSGAIQGIEPASDEVPLNPATDSILDNPKSVTKPRPSKPINILLFVNLDNKKRHLGRHDSLHGSLHD
jgi:hypothetical protein